jgi:radical SAM superfamily enzyme YgiQ (UPF0313 family)
MSLKLTLIAPKKSNSERELFDGKFVSLLYGTEKYSCFALSLATIAALTPDDIDIRIIDENLEQISYDDKVDIVGITANTSMISRAYEIAEEYKKRDVTVVIGGIHASMLPDEAIQHCNSVVIGEAENVWQEFIEDCKLGRAKKFYKSELPPSLNNLPIPRRDLLKNEHYNFHSIQMTRGCPYNCEFCSVKAIYGAKYRWKPVEKVIEEVNQVKRLGGKLIFFSDDNFIGNREHTKELLQQLIPLNITYFTQVSIDVAEDDELLDLLSASGCRKMGIGLESISQSNLTQMNKAKCNKVEKYVENINKLQSLGFEIETSIIFGCDHDDETVFERTVDFINQANIITVLPNILTPFPGTRLFERLESENRIIHKDWNQYDSCHVCFKPKQMSPEVLQNGYMWVRQELYSLDNILSKLKKLWAQWNRNKVRNWDRISPLIANLSMNDVNYSYPIAIHPSKFIEKES